SCRWRTIACAPLLLFIVCFLGGHAHAQETQNPDLEQLKNKLQQLDEEMQELKAQIQAAEEAQRALGNRAQPKSAAVAAPGQTQTVPREGEETERKSSIDIYGFVMLDSGYDFKQENRNWFDVLRPTQLPSYQGEYAPNGNVFASVRQTRFGVKSSTPTAVGDLNTIFEFELFGTGVDAGQTTFRLRHAYGELGAFGAGQTWSPFMDIDVFPNSLEYWGPSGMVFYRNVQVRWMPLRGERTKVTIAAERPGATADQGQYSDFIELQDVRPRFNVPDISGNVRFIRKWGYVQMAGIFRKIGWVQTQPSQFNLSGTAYGWGVNLTSNVQLGKKDVGKFEVVYGHAISNYMNDATTDIGIQNNSGNPVAPIKGVALPLLGVVSFIDHNWSERFQSSIGYSMINIQNSDGDLPTAYHQGHYALANILFHPVKAVTVGSEFQFGRRLNFSDGFNTNDYRIQFSFKYDWSNTFGGEY